MEQIKLLVGNKGNIDLDCPPKMTNEEKTKFLELMNTLFYPVNTFEIKEFEKRTRLNEKTARYHRVYHKEEYEFLLNSSSIKEAYTKLGVPRINVILKMREVIPKYFVWCEKNNLDESVALSPENISAFAEELVKRKEEEREFNKKIAPELKSIQRKIRYIRKKANKETDEKIKQDLMKEESELDDKIKELKQGYATFHGKGEIKL